MCTALGNPDCGFALSGIAIDFFIGARGRSRTGMGYNSRGILSPLRLPISPPGQILKAGAGIEPTSTALQAAA